MKIVRALEHSQIRIAYSRSRRSVYLNPYSNFILITRNRVHWLLRNCCVNGEWIAITCNTVRVCSGINTIWVNKWFFSERNKSSSISECSHMHQVASGILSENIWFAERKWRETFRLTTPCDRHQTDTIVIVSQDFWPTCVLEHSAITSFNGKYSEVDLW